MSHLSMHDDTRPSVQTLCRQTPLWAHNDPCMRFRLRLRLDCKTEDSGTPVGSISTSSVPELAPEARPALVGYTIGRLASSDFVHRSRTFTKMAQQAQTAEDPIRIETLFFDSERFLEMYNQSHPSKTPTTSLTPELLTAAREQGDIAFTVETAAAEAVFDTVQMSVAAWHGKRLRDVHAQTRSSEELDQESAQTILCELRRHAGIQTGSECMYLQY